VASDSPTNQFKRFQSPLLLGRNETTSIAVTILNPTSESLEYTVHIEARGLSIQSPEQELEITVPGGQTAEIAWVVTAIESGNQTVAVQAVSDRDAALPGPYHMWPTSFRQGCGILVIGRPWTGKLVLLSSLVCVPIGAILSFPRLYAKLKRRTQREQPD
jgi:hypothetical protein